MAKLIVKICGITRMEDAQAALGCGADWVGLNLVGGPRRLEIDRALQIVSQLADPAAVVVLIRASELGLPDDEIGKCTDAGVRRFQLYGDVLPDHLAELAERGLESILVHQVGTEEHIADINALLAKCKRKPDYLLLDAHVPGMDGGTGQAANWQAIRAAQNAGRTADWPPVLAAGGLNPENVGEVVLALKPTGVDVSSGVESRPGEKDVTKVAAFVREAQRASVRAD